MKLRTIVNLLMVCLVLSISAKVFAGTQTVFGPETFTINKFHVNLSNRIFRVDESCDAVITIQKNTPAMNISSGFLIFNWRLIPLTEFLKGGELAFHLDAAVKSLNNLTVFLAGKPGASVQILISKKEILPPPEIDFISESHTIISGESTLLTWITENATSCRIEPGIGNVDLNGSMDVSPKETTTYILTAAGPGGTKTADLAITVLFPPTVQIHVSPETIPAGGEATLSWNSEHAESVMIDNEIGAVTPDGSVTVSPGQTTTYTITASGTGGTAIASATVSIAHPEPSVTLQASSSEITAGQTAELSWASSYAGSATLDQGIGTVPVNGSISVSPSSTTTYTITVSGPGGSRTAFQTIAVRHLPEIQISASPDIIQKGQTSQISWSSAHADTVTIQPGIGLVAQSGSITIAPETTTRYTITATGLGGTATAGTAITVICLPPAIEFSATPQTLPAGQSAVLTWNIAHSDTCEIQPDIGKVDNTGSVTVTPENTITYTLTATGTGGTSSADIAIMVNQPPAIILEKPDQTNTETDASCRIEWNDSDADDNARISLYYDTDNQGADGTLIVSGIKEDYDDKTDDAYLWDTLDIPPGNYCIYAVIEDSVNAPVVNYAEGTVTIAHPSAIPDVTLTAGDADAEDYFGESVAIQGNTALIGASGDDESGVDAGALYVFKKDKTGWKEESKIQPDDASAGDHFGASIAMDGEFAAIGAYGKGNNKGVVYIFQNIGGNWLQQAKLMAADGMSCDYFGASLCIRNGFVIIGAYGRNISGPNTGAVYIFKNEGDNWVQVARLTANAGAAGDYFGGSVAIFGNFALVGAPGNDQSGEDSGKAYVYQYDGHGWILNAELDAPDGVPGGYFGTSVALNQEFLAIGATGAKTTNEAISGAVYMFYHDGNQWVQNARITAGIPVNNGMDAAFQNRPLAMNRLMADMTPWYLIPFLDRFGGHIIMDEKILAILIKREYGANRIKIVRPTIEDPEKPDNTPGWEPVVIISSDDSEEDDGFGESIDIDNNNLIIGSPKKDLGAKDTGGVNIYTVPSYHRFQEVKLTAGYAETELDKFGKAMAADGDRLIIGAPDDPNSGLHSGAAHIFVKNNGMWIRETTLTANDAGDQDYFGGSVDIEGDFAIVGAFQKKISGVSAGAAYIFQKKAGIWTQTARLYGDDLTEEIWFGASVSISNGFAVVGAPNENSCTGVAYVFHYNGTTWERYEKLHKDLELSAVGDFFAESLSLDRNRLVIGIPRENNGRGAIQFFHFDGTDWIQQTKINGLGQEYFGEAVALYGDYAIAGMAGDDHDLGAYYIFQWDGTNWTETAQLMSGENFPESRFGTSVAISDQYAVVGSANNSPVSGSAFIYQNYNGSWSSIAKVAAGDTDMFHAFGTSVAISGESFVVGSFENFTADEFGNSVKDFCGAVYVYSLSKNTGGTDSSVSINASANIVLQGESTTLTWDTKNISACTIAPEIGTVDLEGSMKVYPDRTTTYTITGHGPEGNVDDSITISVVANKTPTVTLNATPSTFRNGEPVTLSWESENAVSCSIDNNIGDRALSGSIIVRPTQTTTYTITAKGLRTVTTSATVTLEQRPSVDLTASAETVEKGGAVTLRWRSVNADTAFIQGIGGVPVNAGAVIALNKTTTFIITVTGPGGTATDTVTVVAIDPVPTVSIIAIPETVYLGESTAIGWLSEDADKVVMGPDFGEVILKGSRIVYPKETTTYTVTATGPGGTASASITVEVQSPIELTITSPAMGETITRPDVLVEGTFHHVKGLETGIVVNGIPAMIHGNRFVANHVPLISGQETIRVVATDIRGITNTAYRNLNMDVSGHYITLKGNPESGLSPLETSLTIDGTFSIPDSTLTSSDSSVVESLESNADNYKIVVTGNGFYYLTATVQNPEGGTCSDTVAVLAQDREEFDAKLRAKWEGMKAGLRFGNIESAVEFIEKSKKEIYDYNFNLLKDHLTEIEAGMDDLTLVKAQDGIAEYVMKGEQGGQQYSFYVMFVKDSDGIWRISHF